MSGDQKIDPKMLRRMVGAAELEVEEPTPFARQVATVLARALDDLRANGVVEVEEGNREGLAAQVVGVALEASSPRKMSRQIVATLIRSDLVEEVYGSDDEIARALQPYLEEL